METAVKNVYLRGTGAVTSLGCSFEENWARLCAGMTGIQEHVFPSTGETALQVSLVDGGTIAARTASFTGLSRLEGMLGLTIGEALAEAGIDPAAEDTAVFVSTTKGNIDRIGSDDAGLPLWTVSEALCRQFGFRRTPVVVSTACISGTLALIAAFRQLRSGRARHAIVTGGDLLTDFILSGFQSLKAVSPVPCRPFDRDRKGMTPGEGAGTVILSVEAPAASRGPRIMMAGGAVSNDANHISGPSRTGDGLLATIEAAMKEAGIGSGSLDCVLAHGTATPYNDEMEARALSSAGLGAVPVSGVKGYIGHTFGATGILEAAIAARQLRENTLIGTLGYGEHGVSVPLAVNREKRALELGTCLKTSSGFGGTNASIVLAKGTAS